MGDHEEIIRRSYAAFNRRDPEDAVRWLHPDFEVDLSGSMGFDRGTYRGADGLRRFFQGFWDAFDEITIQIEELYAADDAIVAYIRARGRGVGSGAPVDASGPHRWTFRDGMVTGVALHASLEQALEAAGLADAPRAGRPEPI